MVVVNSHVASLAESGREELGELIVIAQECEKALHEVYRPDGFNLGFNLGKCAGAGVAGHLHLHVLPRWIGDSNVVSVVGQTRIIPEELDSSFEKLVPLLQKR
jgi:ATP adenylyltransferase